MVKRISGLVILLASLWAFSRGQTFPAIGDSSAGYPVDSLHFQPHLVIPAKPASQPRLAWNRQTTVGTVVTLSAGLAAVYCHKQAERAYQRYLRSGNYAEIRRQYRLAQRYDRLTGWAYALAEGGFVLTVFSFDK